ncbi:MAG TPA: sulfite exporter TauE/SafE family protein [Nitrososphaera sp.]
MTDFLIYWFMLPLSTMVATTAMLGGIGGAAMFVPIFLILFPFLGPEYVLAGPVAAIGVALLTESFGFSSGLIGYLRRGLIDFGVAKPFILLAVPAAIAGALLSNFANPDVLKLAYGALMLILTFFLLRRPKPKEMEIITTNAQHGAYAHIGHKRSVTTKEGIVYNYHICHRNRGSYVTSVGGFITGLMSVGIGEVLMPQLVRHCKIPVPVAAATSVLVVIVTVMSASFTHISSLISEGGIEAVPWHLVAYTAPGVIIGGQIGSRLQGRIPSEKMERIVATLFGVIGIAMIWIVIGQLL